MPLHFRQCCKIKSTDKNYMQQIAKYNSRISITHINGKEYKSSDKCIANTIENLDVILKKMHIDPKQDLIIHCLSFDSTSAIGVLPKAIPQIELPESKIHENIDAYVKCFVTKEKNISDIFPPSLIKFTEVEAYFILNKINATGALHFPDLQKIIFAHDVNFFELTYGLKPSINHIILRLDMETGFSPFMATPTIKDRLNEFFFAWKKGEPEAPIFPSYNCVDKTKIDKAVLPRLLLGSSSKAIDQPSVNPSNICDF